ncbi:MAG: hypothetical protein Q9168_006037 [Polycauliona sp. 1 TL-2023]
MEAVGLAASLGQLIEITAKTIKYLNSVKEASKERATLFQEASSLLPLLVSLQAQINAAKQSEPWFDDIKLLGVENGPLDQLCEALVQLTRKLKPKQGINKAARAIIWPFDKAYCEGVLHKIERVKSSIVPALQAATFKLAQAIKADTAGINKQVGAVVDGIAAIQLDGDLEKRQETLDWFSPLNFFKTQQDIFARREEGTGQWLIDSPTFQSWLSGSDRTLCCPGIPGAGKTILASFVVDFLRTKQRKSSGSVGVAAIYCNFKEREMQTSLTLLAGACAQLIQDSMQPLPDALKYLHNRHEPSGTRPSSEEIRRVFDDVVRSCNNIYIVVDAVDECSEEVRNTLVPALKALPDNVRILITTRPIHEITHLFPSSPKLEIRATDTDLTKYISSRIANNSRLARHVHGHLTLEHDICTLIKAKADGMFLAAKLLVDILSTKTSVQKLKKALKDLPSTLDGLYDDALHRIDSQSQDDRELAEKALRWVAYAFRPLSIPMVRQAVAIDSEETDYDPEAMPAIDLILDVCSGLLIVDEEANVVRLVHYTAQDYFNASADSRIPGPHAAIAGECLTYLEYDTFQKRSDSASSAEEQGSSAPGSKKQGFASNFDEDSAKRSNASPNSESFASTSVEEGSTRGSEKRGFASNFKESSFDAQGFASIAQEYSHFTHSPYPLLGYASTFWALHAKASPSGLKSELNIQIRQFLENDPCVVLMGTALYGISWSEDLLPGLESCKGYGIAAFFGLCDSLHYLLPRVDNIDAPIGWRGFCALQAAAHNNQTAAIEILLTFGANIECAEHYKDTPLLTAIKNHSVAAATTLVHRGADVMAQDLIVVEDLNDDEPIALVSWREPRPFLECLLKAGAQIQEHLIFGRNRLMSSIIENEDIETAQWLFDHATLCPRQLPIFSPAFCIAVDFGSVEIVELLLDRGANINSHRFRDNAPLHLAFDSRSPKRYDLIKLLVDRGINLDAVNDWGNRTALQRAVFEHQDDLAYSMLHHGASTSNRDNGGNTALHLAIYRDNPRIVLALLQHGADADIQDEDGMTAVHVASATGRWRILDELIKRHVAVDTQCKYTVALTYSEPDSSPRNTYDLHFALNIHCGSAVRGKLLQLAALQSPNLFHLWETSAEAKMVEWRVFPDGMTALDIAMLRNDQDTIRLLKPPFDSIEVIVAQSIDQPLCELPQVLSIEELLGELKSNFQVKQDAIDRVSKILKA